MTHDYDADEELQRIYREEAAKILSVLILQAGDFDLAEDALHDALAEAVVVWRRDGPPRNGAAWLLTAGRRRAVDRMRRATVRGDASRLRPLLERLRTVTRADRMDPGADPGESIPDERLRLIFVCCHPALPPDSRIALTLRSVCGLTTDEIARAFLVPESTLAQRLVRAKRKIREKGIPFDVPRTDSLDMRLESVLEVVYLIFNEGYSATIGKGPTRADLCEEAIRLARVLYGLKPHPEVGGLLALLLLHDARRAARVDTEGRAVPLEEQNRRLWNRQQVAEGIALTRRCLAHRRPGPYQIQAAISAVHAEARRADETDWVQIAGLYVAPSQADPSPVVTVNHAVALSYARDPEAGLALLDSVGGELDGYQPLFAARADLLRRLRRWDESAAAYRRAIALTKNDADRRLLERRLARVLESAR